MTRLSASPPPGALAVSNANRTAAEQVRWSRATLGLTDSWVGTAPPAKLGRRSRWTNMRCKVRCMLGPRVQLSM